MSLINEHYLKLSKNYLFADIAKKVNAYKATHPGARVISLGIGDVTQPLCPAVIEAMHKAVDEMTAKDTFHGYGPEQGYMFLREAIVKNDYLPRGVHIDPSEVFVNDGAKSDTGNIGELVRWDNSFGVADPVYPVYIDSNVMCGRAGTFENGRWSNVTYLPCTEAGGFKPQLPDHRVDLIYLCYPNNPTGMTLTKDELRQWVNYALKNDAIIFYDAAYEAFIQDPDIPHSIYEIKGARRVAIEFRSYSKTAGFTGVRCGYTVVPKEVTAASMDGTERYSRRGHIYAGGQGAGEGHHRLLLGQRPPDERRADAPRPESVRRRERPLPVGEDTRRRGQLALLRAHVVRRAGGMHARRGLRPVRRRLRAPELVRRQGRLPRGHEENSRVDRKALKGLGGLGELRGLRGLGKT